MIIYSFFPNSSVDGDVYTVSTGVRMSAVHYMSVINNNTYRAIICNTITIFIFPKAFYKRIIYYDIRTSIYFQTNSSLAINFIQNSWIIKGDIISAN